MKKILYILLGGLMLASCSLFSSKEEKDNKNYSKNRERMEVEAQGHLSLAREQLAHSQYDLAKATIQKMRKDCYLALDARKEGILLMDTIDLKIAQKELAEVDSMLYVGVDTITKEDFEEACRKVQFYERKIQFDKKK